MGNKTKQRRKEKRKHLNCGLIIKHKSTIMQLNNIICNNSNTYTYAQLMSIYEYYYNNYKILF